MKLLVFSDSHGKSDKMREAIEAHKADTRMVVHLGDGKREFLRLMQLYPDIQRVSVNGNGEDPLCLSHEIETVIDVYGLRIFVTHGHKYGVNAGLEKLIQTAHEQECDIALFGHTHVRHSGYIPPSDGFARPLYIVNPGSITLPRDSRCPSYAIIRIAGGRPIISIATL